MSIRLRPATIYTPLAMDNLSISFLSAAEFIATPRPRFRDRYQTLVVSCVRRLSIPTVPADFRWILRVAVRVCLDHDRTRPISESSSMSAVDPPEPRRIHVLSSRGSALAIGTIFIRRFCSLLLLPRLLSAAHLLSSAREKYSRLSRRTFSGNRYRRTLKQTSR